jgi:hypothetical protein
LSQNKSLTRWLAGAAIALFVFAVGWTGWHKEAISVRLRRGESKMISERRGEAVGLPPNSIELAPGEPLVSNPYSEPKPGQASYEASKENDPHYVRLYERGLFIGYGMPHEPAQATSTAPRFAIAQVKALEEVDPEAGPSRTESAMQSATQSFSTVHIMP